MFDFEIETYEGFKQGDFFIDEQIRSFSFEKVMFFDFDTNIEISGQCIRLWG